MTRSIGHPHAVLFDLDGVVIDSHDQHELAWERLAEKHRRPLLPNFFKESFGMRNQTIFRTLLPWTTDPDKIARLSEEKEEFYREILAKTGLTPLPGAAPLLKELHALGIPAVLATSTPRSNVDAVMRATGLGDYFADVISGCDVENGKPDPEVFLKAAAAANAAPSDCVVIEDAHVGIRAGRDAGCKVLAVTTTHPADSLAADHPTEIVPSLDSITVAHLSALFQETE